MRFQGKILDWKDDQGFGFVAPNGGGQKAFIHIKAFSSRNRRPVIGDIITYEAAKDAKGRLTAVDIRYISEKPTPANSGSGSSLGLVFLLGLFAFLAVTVSMEMLPSYIITIYLIASAVTFIAYALDKAAARSNRWRTAESTLHLFSLACGWPGALLGQHFLRHKSKKEEFRTVFWGTVIINCIALGWLVTNSGSALLASL